MGEILKIVFHSQIAHQMNRLVSSSVETLLLSVPEKVFDTEVIADDFQGLLTPLRCTVCMAAEGGTEMTEA